MRSDIRLFIHGQEIEFNADPKILLNYKETELHNPTIIRNSFTKQINVEGTNQNNDIFGNIWELTRIQDGNFNPIKKTDFQLFVNGELTQKGYCKLDKVTRTNNTTEYSLTLYGGLGQFFYNLTYDQDSDGNLKKTLADLTYNDRRYGSVEPADMDFTIDKDNVYEAWGQIAGLTSTMHERWNIINFIPALNGTPSSFDASKVLINNYHINQHGASGFINQKTEGGITYMPVLNGALNLDGYSMGEMPDDLQEWQTRDLRCYNQRPVVSMYRIIQACCQPENNGGYQVKLDEHFFHQNNPYYFDSWVTMPMLKDLEGVGGGETYDITGATISTASSSSYGSFMYPVVYDAPTLASLNNVSMDISVVFNPADTVTYDALYPHHYYVSNGFTLLPNEYVDIYERNQGIIMQLFAIGSAGEVVGQSKAYMLGGQKNWSRHNVEPMWQYFYGDDINTYGDTPDYEFLEGYFKRIDGQYVWCDMYGREQKIKVTFNAPNDFALLLVKIAKPFSEDVTYLLAGYNRSTHASRLNDIDLYSSKRYQTYGLHTKNEAYNQDRVSGNISFVVSNMEGIATDYEGLFSGTKITKQRLLTTKNTPADYLISYCKLFGLYFYYDPAERSDDPELYPAGVIHIMDRNTFYTDEVVDITKLIDWDKKVEITPAMASTKWYKFDTEHAESELEEAYKQHFGQEYGSQIVNTTYNFNSDTTDLYDGNVFKAGIMALEKDKYYKKTTTGAQSYPWNGLKYNLYGRTSSSDDFNTTEIEFPVRTTSQMVSINPDYEFYDAFPKLVLHGEDNEPIDGSNILVFLRGGFETNTDYWITDDVAEMSILNDGSPCWIYTDDEYDADGTQIARKISRLPVFTRDLVLYASEYGNIVHSWNFGHPQVIYSPDTYTTPGDSIYDVAWKNYIRDLYDVDTRKLTCYVRAEMDDRPWPYWLRRFYWFNNTLWRLNEIKDLNLCSYDTTKMEFIKVQDIENYKLDRIEYQGHNQVILDQRSLDCTGGTITGKVVIQSAGAWVSSDYIVGVDGDGNSHYLIAEDYMTPYRGRGEVTTPFSIRIPANEEDTPITWTVQVIDDFDDRYRATFVQETCSGPSLSITPSAFEVSSTRGTVTFTLKATQATNVTVITSAPWLTLTREGNVLNVSYEKNATTAQRTATIAATGLGPQGETLEAYASLIQHGLGQVTVSPTTLEFDWIVDGDGSTASKNVNITTSDEWTSSINDNTQG